MKKDKIAFKRLAICKDVSSKENLLYSQTTYIVFFVFFFGWKLFEITVVGI